MDICTIVAAMKKHRDMPAQLTFYTDRTKNMARVYGFKNQRFDSVAILCQPRGIKLMLIMSNRLVHVPTFGYLGVRSFDDADKAAVELVRLTRLR